jgi:hypothetical protein
MKIIYLFGLPYHWEPDQLLSQIPMQRNNHSHPDLGEWSTSATITSNYITILISVAKRCLLHQHIKKYSHQLNLILYQIVPINKPTYFTFHCYAQWNN